VVRMNRDERGLRCTCLLTGESSAASGVDHSFENGDVFSVTEYSVETGSQSFKPVVAQFFNQRVLEAVRFAKQHKQI